MDAHLKPVPVSAPVLLCALTLWCGSTAAADINDPTLPPAPIRATASPRSTEDAPLGGLQIRMIVRGPGESRIAIVDGRSVRVGDNVAIEGGKARVVRITEGALVVRRADHRIETIEMMSEAALAVRCRRAVGATAVPCANDGTSAQEPTR